MNINDNAVIVKVTIGYSNCQYIDKGIESEVKESHGLQNNTAKVMMQPIDPEYLSGLLSKGQKIRMIVEKETLPWLTGGLKIIRKDCFEGFRDKIKDEITDFNLLAHEFIAKYAEIKEKSRLRMNGAWDESKFPSREELESKYYIDIDTFSVSNDFRCEESDNRKIQAAMATLFEMVKDCCQDCIEKLKDDKARFKVMLKNVTRTVTNIRNLNLTDDEQLNQTADKLEQLFIVWNSEELKNNKEGRDILVKDVESLMAAM